MARVIIHLKQSFILVLPCLSGQLVLGERLQGICAAKALHWLMVMENFA